MAELFKPGGVRDVPHGDFIAAYAKHLKGNDRVRFFFLATIGGGFFRVGFGRVRRA
jgi:hypothetical protein